MAFHRAGDSSLGLLAERGLAYDVIGVLPRHLEHAGALADALPDLRLVIDHLGTPPVGADGEEPWAGWMRALAERDNVWVKLSGLYRSTGLTNTPYDDTRPFIDALIDANPRQLLWGTDWPHPSIAVPMPDDTDLVDQFGAWVEDEALRQAILVDNPERLYGFEPYVS